MGGGPFKNAEGGSKNYECQFQFLDPPKHTLVNISWNLALSVLQFGGYKKVFRPLPKTHTLTIYNGRYLKADHFEKKNWTWVVGHSKMLKGGLKNYEC